MLLEVEDEVKTLYKQAKPLGVTILTHISYGEENYKVVFRDTEFSCGTSIYSLRSWLRGFLADK